MGQEVPTLMVDPRRGTGRGADPSSVTREVGPGAVKKIKPGPGPRPPLLAPEQMHELAGHYVSHYWIGDVIARGRTGLVFRAQDLKSNRPVALKILWPDFVREPSEVKRLIRSMRTMLPLNHPHLVRIFAAGRTGPYCWIAMEQVDGESVARLVERTAAQGKPDWQSTLRVAIHISRALVFAHYHRIIHRNITPTNVLIAAPDQQGKLGDLMLAKALEGTLAEQVTAPGQLLGDVGYLPPERITAGTGEADVRSDIYSLGATLYAMLTGFPPLRGGNIMETIRKIWEETPTAPNGLQPSVPGELSQLIMCLLAKDPAQRPQTAAQLLGQFNQLATKLGVKV
jgi:serine/threonine protein kinase